MFSTSWGLSCAHIAPRGGFDLGQPALHGPWDEGWSNSCPFEVFQNSSAEVPNMYREVPRLSPSKIDVITKENYSKGFRSPLQIAWNITRSVTHHLSSAPKINHVWFLHDLPPRFWDVFTMVFYHHKLCPFNPKANCSGSSSGPGACFALFGTVWKALCDASPDLCAPCGWGTQHPTWRSWMNTVLTIQHQLTILEGWDSSTMVDGWMIQWRTQQIHRNMTEHCFLFLDPSLVGGKFHYVPQLQSMNAEALCEKSLTCNKFRRDWDGFVRGCQPFFWQVFFARVLQNHVGFKEILYFIYLYIL